MEKQQKLDAKEYDNVYIFFREVSSQNLKKRTLQDNQRIRKFLEILKSFSKQTNSHKLENLDIDDNPEMFVHSVFEDYPDVDDRMPSMFVNSFTNSMKTRAREEGKYAVLVIMKDSIIICHTDSKEKTVSKDVNVIERLLDIDNVDKYVEFQKSREKSSDEILVSHFERHKTKSLENWLGLPKNSLSFKDAGSISFYTEIDDATCSFEFTMTEFEEKFLVDEKFEIEGNKLKTPQGNRYSVNQVKLGRKTFDDLDKFQQDFLSIFYNIETYDSVYRDIVNSLEPMSTKIVDFEDKVSESGGDLIISKENPNFQITFVNKFIDMDVGWSSRLYQKFSTDDEIRIYHPALSITENPTKIGNFEFYNDLDLDEENLKWINSYHYFISSSSVGEELKDIILFSLFSFISEITKEPLSHFFRELKEESSQRINTDGVILQSENDFLEFKGRPWFSKDKSELIKDINKEIQNEAKLLIGGINEEEQRIRPLNRNNLDSEYLDSVEKKLQERNDDFQSIMADSIPLGDGNCLIFILCIKGETNIPAEVPKEGIPN